jgi:hypothetical protein
MRDEKEEIKSLKIIGERSDKEKKKEDLRKRLKEYALRIIRLYESLPKHGAVHVISHQLLRSGTSPERNIEKPAAQNPMPILSAK